MSDAQGVPAGGSGLSAKTYMQGTLDEIVKVGGRTSIRVLLALANSPFLSVPLVCFRGLSYSKKEELQHRETYLN